MLLHYAAECQPKRPLAVTLTVDVNPLETPAERLTGGNKEAFYDLFETINDFLESNRIEIYRMEVGSEAYQVRHNGQTIRFYVHREKIESPAAPEMGEICEREERIGIGGRSPVVNS